MLLFFVFGVYRGLTRHTMLARFVKLYAIHYLRIVILHCSSLFLTPNLLVSVYKQIDPLGEEGKRYHELFDELYRADNARRNYGTYNRTQGARNFAAVNREAHLG